MQKENLTVSGSLQEWESWVNKAWGIFFFFNEGKAIFCNTVKLYMILSIYQNPQSFIAWSKF